MTTDYHVESRISNVDYKLRLALKEWLEVRSEYDEWIEGADPAAHLTEELRELLEDVAAESAV